MTDTVHLYWSDNYQQYYYLSEDGDTHWVTENEQLSEYAYQKNQNNDNKKCMRRLTVQKRLQSKQICINNDSSTYYVNLTQFLSAHLLNSVVSIQIKQAVLPHTFMNVPRDSDVEINGHKVSVPSHMYSTCEELCTVLARRICDELNVTLFITYRSTTGHCYMSSEENFTINYKELGTNFGFENNTVYTSVHGTLTSPYLADISGTKLVKIKVEELETVINEGVVDYIALGTNCGNVTTYSNTHLSNFVEFGERPVKSLTVHLLDQDNRPIDCQGARHTIIWHIVYMSYELM